MPQQQPTPEQLEALKAYATLHGRKWKHKLNLAWVYCDYEGFADSHLLQQIRNQFGPTWLTHFRLPKEGA